MTDLEILRAAEVLVRAHVSCAVTPEQTQLLEDTALGLMLTRADIVLDSMADYLTAQVVAEASAQV